MKIASLVSNVDSRCRVTLRTNGNSHELSVASKADGQGLRANGGELLCSALGACFCNDIYREAATQGIEVVAVEVEVCAEFGGVGEPARSLEYSATVSARASSEEIQALIEQTDKVSEIQNTLRQGMPVTLSSIVARPVK
jgi:organic hydroperoxide reductase OsmC/OhrA